MSPFAVGDLVRNLLEGAENESAVGGIPIGDAGRVIEITPKGFLVEFDCGLGFPRMRQADELELCD